MNRALLVMLVGDLSAEADFVAPPAGCELVRVADLEAALEWVETHRIEPAVLLVPREWPGQTPPTELDQLAARLPLTRICSVADSWCEGEQRSGKPWPGGVRAYGHQFASRAGRELEHLARWEASAWALPVTAAEDERLAVDVPRADESGQLVAVVAAAFEAGAALADACRALGYRACQVRDPSGVVVPDVQAVVWDTTASLAADCAAIARLASSFPHAPLVAVLGFPRTDEIAAARAAGVAQVVSKPFLLADLQWHLQAAIARRPSTAGS